MDHNNYDKHTTSTSSSSTFKYISKHVPQDRRKATLIGSLLANKEW